MENSGDPNNNRNQLKHASDFTVGGNFTGMRSDIAATGGATNGLFDFLARELPPTQGRWISPDSSGLAAVDMTNPQTLNRYAYVANNPLSFVDPTGMNTKGPGGGGCNSDLMNCDGGGGTGYSGSGGDGWGFNQGSDMNGFGWSSGVGDFGGSGNPYALLSGAGALQAGVSRYLSIMRTGWDPALGLQYYEYDITGGDAFQRQKALAAIQLAVAACGGQGLSAVDACIQAAYDTLYLKAPNGAESPLVGGNYNFDSSRVEIPGADISASGLGCIWGRCGLLDSLHFHQDGTFHVDTANPWFFPIGTVLHGLVDVVGGHTWWSGGIPR